MKESKEEFCKKMAEYLAKNKEEKLKKCDMDFFNYVRERNSRTKKENKNLIRK